MRHVLPHLPSRLKWRLHQARMMLNMGRLLAIDGLNIVRRVYEASPEPDSPEKAEIALRHALSSLRTLIHDHQPTHLLPAFDYGGSTWRHTLYAGYRAGRAPMPSPLREALPAFY